MKVYTKLFLNEIYYRIKYLVHLYENKTSYVKFDEKEISEFNVNILVRKGYATIKEEKDNKLISITESGINFVRDYIDDFKKVS